MYRFKYINYTSAIILLFTTISTVSAQSSELGDVTRVQYFGEDLFNKHGTSPKIADWNGDGLKDLIVGFHYRGWVYVYLNSGTNSIPVFETELIQLKADDEIIAYENQ